MRVALAIATVLLLLVVAVAPHTHGGDLGSHACLACATTGGEQAEPATPEVRPLPTLAAVVLHDSPSPVTGAPLGAVPGQSPPARS